MTQPPDQPSGLPPEQEAVRRLLADARHDGPTPPEVVARLDATLASLAAERQPGSSTTTAPVIDLGARRRRTAGIGLLAAAAVVVAGVALGPGLPSMQGGSDADSSASAGDTATSQRELADDSAGGADSGGADSQEMQPQPKEPMLSPGLEGYPELFTFAQGLDEDLVGLRANSRAASAGSESSLATVCEVPDVGRGRQVLAEIDGALGLVVFRRADGASQQVDLYACGDPTAVRTLTLPAP